MSGMFTQSTINLMNAYSKIINNCKLGKRVWRWFLTLPLDLTFNFKECNHILSIEHALDYISRNHVGLRNETMKPLWQIWKLVFLDIDGSARGNYSHISMSTE